MLQLILEGIISPIIESLMELLDVSLLAILKGMLQVETMADAVLSDILSAGTVDSVYQFIYLFACGLIGLKFLWRGFEVWILWRNGDADSSPQDMLIGMGQAVAVMLGFPFLYEIMTEVTLWFADELLGKLSTGDVAFTAAAIATANPLVTILFLVYIVMAVVLFVMLIRRGFELLILRLGVPLGCLGLLDSDYGFFKTYIQTFWRALFTSVVQIVLFSISARVAITFNPMNILFAIAAASASFNTPALLQQILLPGGHGGGIGNKLYSGVRVAQSLRSLIGK